MQEAKKKGTIKAGGDVDDVLEWGVSGGAGDLDEEQERELVLDLIQ